jgi:hypothetical protein
VAARSTRGNARFDPLLWFTWTAWVTKRGVRRLRLGLLLDYSPDGLARFSSSSGGPIRSDLWIANAQPVSRAMRPFTRSPRSGRRPLSRRSNGRPPPAGASISDSGLLPRLALFDWPPLPSASESEGDDARFGLATIFEWAARSRCAIEGGGRRRSHPSRAAHRSDLDGREKDHAHRALERGRLPNAISVRRPRSCSRSNRALPRMIRRPCGAGESRSRSRSESSCSS